MLSTLSYSISGGMLVVLSTARVEQIAWKFLRLASILAFTLAVAPSAWLFREAASSPGVNGTARCGTALGLAAMFLIFASPGAATHSRLFRVVSGLGGLIGLAAASLGALETLAAGRAPERLPLLVAALVVLGQSLGAWILGSITVAWLLGHAYLTATSMTIAPLRHFSRMLSWAVATRILFMLISLMIAWQVRGDPNSPILERVAQSWLIVVLRVGVGLLAVAVFAYMVADCVRLRSTQSATGILYFGSVMAYVGELASQQLMFELGWPV